jgi:hypothetical protein
MEIHMITNASTFSRWAVAWGAAILSVSAVAQQAPAAFETNEAVAASGFSQRPRPMPRGGNLMDVFPAERVWSLPALGGEDVVGVGGTLPAVNGRVYELAIRSDLDGTWTELDEGGMLWTLTVRSPNAAGIRLRIENFPTPGGAELVVYNPGSLGEAFGPLGKRERGTDLPIWTPRITGNECRLEWFVPAELAEPVNFGSIRVTAAVQIFPDPPAAGERGGGCRLDVTCHPEWNTTAQSVAHYDFIEGGESFICSGAMVTRLPTTDFSPLFLTAAHCIESSAAANSMNIFWFFQTNTCNGIPPSLGSLPLTDGATLLRRDESSDTCLLGLPIDDLPNGITFAGWTSAQAPDPTPATLIHHPLGMRKSWSPGSLLGIETVSQCFTTASDTYDFELTNGGQDGGSSGAPVFDNANHRIRAVATCSESDNCIPDEDCGEGSFAHGYSNMSVYLNPASDIWVQSGWPGGEAGTFSAPFDTLIEGFLAVPTGGTLHLRPGTGYPQPFLFGGPRVMTLVAEGGLVRIGQ